MTEATAGPAVETAVDTPEVIVEASPESKAASTRKGRAPDCSPKRSFSIVDIRAGRMGVTTRQANGVSGMLSMVLRVDSLLTAIVAFLLVLQGDKRAKGLTHKMARAIFKGWQGGQRFPVWNGDGPEADYFISKGEAQKVNNSATSISNAAKIAASIGAK